MYKIHSLIGKLTRIILFLVSSTVFGQNATLIINEFSQGNSGAKEYFEFLVVPTATNPNTCIRPTLDLRKWIFDDNNGRLVTGSGSGSASGSIRFADNAFWSAIPVGTLIVVYSNTDYNSSIIQNDLSMTDGNCKLVIPINNALFEKNSFPTSGNSANVTYPTTGWTSGGNWTNVGMRNDGDGVMIYSSANYSVPVHTLGYGNNSNNRDIYFSAFGPELVYSFMNTVSNDPHNQANWTSASTTSNETPGRGNSPQNQAYIDQLTNNCTPTTASTSLPVVQAIVNQHTTCNKSNGQITASVTGGATPYTYTWNNSSTGSTLTNANSGTYEVIVTDANGCKDTAQVSVNPSQGPRTQLTTTSTSCGQTNGSVTSTVTGGTNPYNYQWSNGSTQNTISNITAGNYQLIVTDANGCKDTTSATVSNSSQATITLTPTHTSCGQNNGAIQSNISGGNGPFTYSWNSGQTTANLTNITSGNYTLTLTDASGCSSQQSITINPSTSIQVIANLVQNENCSQQNGSVSSAVTGGNAPYSYVWSNGTTTANLSNIGAGNYHVIVKDQQGCEAASNTITVTNQAGFTTSIQKIDPTCQNPTGSISITTTGGTAPFSYQWNSGQTSATINNINAGTYEVLITDQAGCQKTETIVVNPFTPIIATVETVAANCAQADGQVRVSIEQGNGPFTYSYTPNVGNQSSLNTLIAGTYSVTITNNEGCTTTKDFSIFQNTNLTVDLTTNHPVIQDDQSATIFSQITPNNLNYTYNWSPTESINCSTCDEVIATPSQTTDYILNVTTPEGCSGSDTIRIAIKKECGDVFVPNQFSPNNDGNNDFFTIYGNCIVKGKISIFNRWGELIFYTDDIQVGWDGNHNQKEVNTGVYIYRIDAAFEDETFQHFNGAVTLVR